jgi:nitronate monooxygenase
MDLDDMKAEAKLDFSGDMHAGTKAWKTVWSAGQGCGQNQQVQPLAEIVDALDRQYNQAGQRLAQRFDATR